MDPSTSSNIPSLSISLSLSPPFYMLTEPTIIPTLSIQITLHASQPITVFTWHNILDPRLALRQNGFEIIDKSTNDSLPQTSVCMKRAGFKRQLGHSDEKLFITLIPEVPYTVQTPFGPSTVTPSYDDLLMKYGKVHRVRGLEKGEYTLQVNRAKTSYHILWWRYGIKEDSLKSAKESGTRSSSTRLSKSEEPSPLLLDVDAIPAVDFSVQ